MPSSLLHPHPELGGQSFASEPPVDPLAPVDQLFHWLADTVVHVGLGVSLGLLAAPVMRRRHLHWSWAATALALVVFARGALGALAPTLATAALTATLRGRRWHHEDLHAGADLTEIAAQRLTPLDFLRFVLRRLAVVDMGAVAGFRRLRPGVFAGAGQARLDALGESRRWRPGALGDSRSLSGELILGEDRRSRPVSIPLCDCSGGVHTLVVGATGSGKTVTQTLIAAAAVQRDMAVLVIDPKEDSLMRSALQCAARIAGAPFIEWTPEGPSVYNPFAHGAPTEIADRALAGERFTEPHYLRQAQRYLGHEVRVLRRCGRPVSLAELVCYLHPERLEVLARSLPESDGAHSYLDSLTPRQLSDLAGVRDRLAIMAESDVAPWLDPRTAGAPVFDLPHALRHRAVVYFDLRADQRPLLAQMLGAAIVQDLQSAVAGLHAHPVPSLVVIDEFSALGAEHVSRLFGRARSAGMSLLLGTQELSDLRLPGHEYLLEQVLGNLSTLIAHRQVVPDSAELVARLAGTHGAWSTSLSSGGHHTRKRVREPLLHPDRIARLPRGYAAVLALTGGATSGAAGVSLVRMRSPQR